VRKQETDISLIKKYLNGELDARAMHRLERRAQGDPFLMDALEGYEKAGSKQQANLDELAGRLKQRVARKERRIVPFKFLAAADSVLAILTIGVLWLYKNHHKKREIAQLIKPQIKPAPVVPTKPVSPGNAEQAVLTPSSNEKHPGQSRITPKSIKPAASIAINEAIANADVKTGAKDTIALNEVTIIGYTAQRKKDITGAVATITSDSFNKPAAAGQLLQGRVAGVAISGSAKSDSKRKSSQTIKGKVIGKNDGLPIAGANVRLAGTNIGAITDVNGMFTLPADSTKTKLAVAFIGYNSRQVNIRTHDTLSTIKLEPANSALSEVVVTGYASQVKPDQAAIIDAHPTAGWSNFKKYLKASAVSPDGKTGVVKLSLTVAPNGTISDIKIEKGLSKAADQKAINLINDGPSWVGSTSGKIEKVRVRIKFTK
jgi:hypothetical protein